MTFVKKFKEGDHVQTNYMFKNCVVGSAKHGVVVNEYQSKQPLRNKNLKRWQKKIIREELEKIGIMIGEKSGKFLHLVEFKDSTGFKHTLNSVYLEKTN
jgi:hypothetical protein